MKQIPWTRRRRGNTVKHKRNKWNKRVKRTLEVCKYVCVYHKHNNHKLLYKISCKAKTIKMKKHYKKQHKTRDELNLIMKCVQGRGEGSEGKWRLVSLKSHPSCCYCRCCCCWGCAPFTFIERLRNPCPDFNLEFNFDFHLHSSWPIPFGIRCPLSRRWNS